MDTTESRDSVRLPEPTSSGEISLEETLATRRSVRQYTDEPLTDVQISQLLGIGLHVGLRPMRLPVLQERSDISALAAGVHRADLRRTTNLTCHQEPSA